MDLRVSSMGVDSEENGECGEVNVLLVGHCHHR